MQIVSAGAMPPPVLVGETVSLALTVLMITAAITIGIAAPLAVAAGTAKR